jgi:hypothetical protein
MMTCSGISGRSERGERVIDHVPQGKWETVTFVAGLRHDGIVAPFVFNGPMTGATFRAYLEQCLVPTLKRDDVVIIAAENICSLEFFSS